MPRSRHAIWLAALAAVAAALLAFSSVASAEATVERYPWELAVLGCDELVAASGTITAVLQTFVIDEAGGIHQHFTVNFNGSGYGVDSGAPYRVAITAAITAYVPTSGPRVNSMEGTYTVVGLGGAGTRTGTAPFHITFNALGDVTSLKDENNITCRGAVR